TSAFLIALFCIFLLQNTVGKNIEGHPYFAYVYANKDTFDNFIVYIFPIENQLKIIGYFLIVFDETDEHYSLTKEWTNDYLNIEIITNIEAIMETYKIKRRMSNESKILNISNNNMMFQRLVNEKNVDTVEQEILLNYLNLSPSCTYISCQIYFKELNNILLSNKKYNFIQDLSDYLIDKTILTNESLHIYFHQKNLIILFEEELFDRSVLDLIITYIKKNYLKGKISIGVSSALPLNKIHSSCTQSFLALSYAKFFDYHRIEMYDHLGFLGIFIDDDGNFNDSQYSTLFERYIKPLKNYDQQNNTSLLKTAISYFTNDMKKKQTSDNLFIHVNTLNARLERIEEVLNIDLFSSKDIVLFGLSLNLYMTLENLLN
uniref:PucR family transcriptional regulator n=1 Tax=Globicatella sulfidifaciens TaxID=136093 RepID=UPI0023F0AD56